MTFFDKDPRVARQRVMQLKRLMRAEKLLDLAARSGYLNDRPADCPHAATMGSLILVRHAAEMMARIIARADAGLAVLHRKMLARAQSSPEAT